MRFPVTFAWVKSHMNDSFTWTSPVSYEWIVSHMNESCLIWISHVSYELCLICTRHLCMGCLRLAGSLKLYVSFAEYCLFYMALLQKRPIILRSLLIEDTSYQNTYRDFTQHSSRSLDISVYRSLLYGSFAKETYTFKEPTKYRDLTQHSPRTSEIYVYRSLLI